MKEQPSDVVAPLAQSREADRVPAQPVQERSPEAPGGDRLLEIGVRGGDEANIDARRLFTPQRLDLAALQGAQQQRLHFLGSLADLVEEERAAVGAAEVAPPRVLGAGVGSPRRPEQLGGGERRRQGAHVERQERPVAPAARAMESRGHKLLSGPRFATQQHRDIEVGDPRDLAAEVENGIAQAHQAVARQAVGEDRAEAMQQEDHAVGEQQHHAAFHLGGREFSLAVDRLAVGGEGDGRVALEQPDAAAGRRPEEPGTAAEIGHGERLESRFAGRGEPRFPPR